MDMETARLGEPSWLASGQQQLAQGRLQPGFEPIRFPARVHDHLPVDEWADDGGKDVVGVVDAKIGPQRPGVGQA